MYRTISLEMVVLTVQRSLAIMNDDHDPTRVVLVPRCPVSRFLLPFSLLRPCIFPFSVFSDPMHDTTPLYKLSAHTVPTPTRGDWKCGSGKCDTSKIAGVENAGVENAGVDRRGGKCGSKLYGTPNQDCIEKILSYIELENAGVDFMAYMTRSRKCESTSHGLHQYTKLQKITPKGA